MAETVHGVTQEELFRLVCAYMAIRDTRCRQEFLSLVESWARDQWQAGDLRAGL